MPPAWIAHFFFGLAETVVFVDGVTFAGAAVGAAFQSIRSSSSSSTSNEGIERPIGFDCMPCAHGSEVMLDVLPCQSIDGAGAVVCGTGAAIEAFVEPFVGVEVALVEPDDVVVVVVGADVVVVVGAEVVVVVVPVLLPLTAVPAVVPESAAVPPSLPDCGSRGPPC